MSFLPLPNHPSLTSIDPLGICETEEGRVSHADLLTELLNQAEADLTVLERTELEQSIDGSTWIKRLQALLQDIAYSLHEVHSLDTEGLKEALSTEWNFAAQVRTRIRQCLFHSARQLKEVFPTGRLQYLCPDTPHLDCDARTIDALLAHMFLGTLQIPPGNTWGRPSFCHYYDGKILPVVRNTAPAYLRTIMLHFAEGGYDVTLTDGHVFRFELTTSAEMPLLASCDLVAVQIHLTVVDIPRDPSSKDNCAVLVAANAQPGPGAGGTQEERLVGQSPALALAALLTPILQPDQVVITSDLPVHAAWEGHGRTSQMLRLYPQAHRPWRRYIIADALPLDLSHAQADLRSGNVQREVGKLYAAFRGAKYVAQQTGKPFLVEMPPWGCGAFGGNLRIKIPCMMMAAGLAGLESKHLELLVPQGQEPDTSAIPKGQVTVRQLYESLVTATQ